MKKFLLAVFLLVGCALSADDSTLKWAADTESGAPNVFYKDGDLSNLVGFEKEIIERISEVLGRQSVFCPNDWDGLVPGLQRNLYDVVINGISPDEVRGQAVLFSDPYFSCHLSLIVRQDDVSISSVLDCNGATIGTLRNSKSQFVLTDNLKNVEIIGYQNEYCALSDLENGRIDAVLLDEPIATYYVKQIPSLKIVDEFGEIKYSIVIALGNDELLSVVNTAIEKIKKDGSLEAIIAKWGLDNDNYRKLDAEAPITEITQLQGADADKIVHQKTKIGYVKMLPFFVKAAGVTLIISVFAMVLAMFFGLGLALVRIYTPKWISFIAVAIIEFLRGTPLLIQLFFIFYGLPCIGITLRPIVAGILTLGINYAAYEAENFRAGLLAVPYGQMEAARALGMSQWQSLRHVILPQAVTFILPPLTNDFISLVKDSSLVSLITIVELTKAYTMTASNSFDFFGTGIIVALIYFLIGFPFVRLTKYAEKHIKLEKRAYNSKRIGGK